MPHHPGDVIHNRYLIKNIIAQGGMGAVYLALDQSLNIQVALKENLLVTNESSRQFRREAAMLGGLVHPNLPRVTDQFALDGAGEYLVMDYIDGFDLREILNQSGPFSVQKSIEIALAICDALTYLHHLSPPIIHRDIKPSNIKISSTGQIVLVDFGLAKLNISNQTTTTGAQSLTPGYAPPEQYGKGTDERTDIYSLGATLYAILTDQVPEDGLARLVGAESLTPLRNLRPDIPVEFSNIIEKAIQVAREKRFQNAIDFKQALLGVPFNKQVSQNHFALPIVTKSGPVSETQARPSKPAAPPPSAKKPFPWGIFAIISGLIGILLVFGLIIFFVFRLNNLFPTITNSHQKTAPPASQATLSRTINARVSEVVSTRTSASSIPTSTATESKNQVVNPTPLKPMDGKIAFTSNRAGSFQVWIMEPDGSSPKQITRLPDGACQPDWSPDGKKLVFISPCSGLSDKYPGSSLFIINSDGSGLSPLPPTPGGDFDPSWSPDGTRIAFTSIRKGTPNIYIMNLNDKKLISFSHPNIIEKNPVWSRDGLWLAYQSTRNNQNQIWIVQKENWSQPRTVTSIDSSAVMPAWAPDSQNIIFSQGNPLPWLVIKSIDPNAAGENRMSEIRPALQPVFSPDGKEVLFVGKENDKFLIFKMSVSDKAMVALTDITSINFNPAWWFPGP